MPHLIQVRSIEDDTELVEKMVEYVTANAETVCGVCGLQVMGHGPQSEWLGYEKHEYQPTPATKNQVEYANLKSSRAYRSRSYMEAPRKLWGKHIQHKRGESY